MNFCQILNFPQSWGCSQSNGTIRSTHTSVVKIAWWYASHWHAETESKGQYHLSPFFHCFLFHIRHNRLVLLFSNACSKVKRYWESREQQKQITSIEFEASCSLRTQHHHIFSVLVCLYSEPCQCQCIHRHISSVPNNCSHLMFIESMTHQKSSKLYDLYVVKFIYWTFYHKSP